MKHEYKQEIEASIRRSNKLMRKFKHLIIEMSRDPETGKIDREKHDKIEEDFEDDSALVLDFLFAAANAERQNKTWELRNVINKFLV